MLTKPDIVKKMLKRGYSYGSNSDKFDSVAWNDVTEGLRYVIAHTRYGHFLLVIIDKVERLRNCVMLTMRVEKVFNQEGHQIHEWEKMYKTHQGGILRWKRIPEIEEVLVWQSPIVTPEELRAKLAEKAGSRQTYAAHRTLISHFRDELQVALETLNMDRNISEADFRLAVRTIMKKWHPDREVLVQQSGGDVEQFKSESQRIYAAVALVRTRLFTSLKQPEEATN